MGENGCVAQWQRQLAQNEYSVGSNPTTATKTMKSEIQIAWAAGLIEGDGCIFLKTNSCLPCVQAEMTDIDVLQRLQSIFGGIIVPIKQDPKHPTWKKTWTWKICKASEAAICINKIRPYLLSRRGSKADEVMSIYNRFLQEKEKEKIVKTERDQEIKRLYLTGKCTQQYIADKFHLERSTISKILSKIVGYSVIAAQQNVTLLEAGQNRLTNPT